MYTVNFDKKLCKVQQKQHHSIKGVSNFHTQVLWHMIEGVRWGGGGRGVSITGVALSRFLLCGVSEAGYDVLIRHYVITWDMDETKVCLPLMITCYALSVLLNEYLSCTII